MLLQKERKKIAQLKSILWLRNLWQGSETYRCLDCSYVKRYFFALVCSREKKFLVVFTIASSRIFFSSTFYLFRFVSNNQNRVVEKSQKLERLESTLFVQFKITTGAIFLELSRTKRT